MNISAINCTPIKPQVITFKSNADFSEKDYEEIEKMADDIQTKYVDSSTIKNPLAIVATIGIAAALGFFGGKRVAGPVKEFTNKFLSNPQKPIDITNPNCEKYFEKPLKNFSKKIRETATSLQEKEGVRFHGFKKTVGIILEKVEESSRSIYKKITNMGITDNLSDAEKGAKKFNNIAGAGGVVAFVPNFASTDNDDNGVADAAQTDQSTYDKGNKKTNKIFDLNKEKSRINSGIKSTNMLRQLVELIMEMFT